MDEALSVLGALDGVQAGFCGRVPGVAVDTDREATLARLRGAHEEFVSGLGYGWDELVRAEQVHGAQVAVVDQDSGGTVVPGVDALVTRVRGLALGIYVADCGVVYCVDAVRGVIGLVHSGKKGTEGNVVGATLAQMVALGAEVKDMRVVLGPCIRPPAYEVDFAAQIAAQVVEAGVAAEHVVDCGVCTSEDLQAYYSYRMESGATGRMLGVLGLRRSG